MATAEDTPTTIARAWALTAAPLGLVVCRAVFRGTDTPQPSWSLGLAIAATAAAALGGIGSSHRPTRRALATTGWLALLGSTAPALTAHPNLALVLALLTIAIIASIWPAADALAHRPIADVRWSAVQALAALFIADLAFPKSGVAMRGAAVAAALGASLQAGMWMRRRSSPSMARIWLVLAAAAAVAASAAALLSAWTAVLTIVAFAPLATLLLARLGGTSVIPEDWTALVIYHPARLVVATFLALCAAATVVLALPAAAASGVEIGLLDAAFTGVSAVCVTGLIVLDTPAAFSPFGEAAILVFIQLGALGIMSLSTAALALLGRRISVRHEEALSDLFSPDDRSALYTALQRTILVTFAFEVVGAVLLTIAFAAAGDSFGTALWRGLFTAVSAFCNAGFALQTQSLVPYQTMPLVLHTVAALIVAGGLSPLVITAVPALIRRRHTSVQVKLVLVATAVLIALGFFGYAALEWHASLAGLDSVDKLHNAWFQSITFRTAGFNSVDLNAMRPATLPLSSALMFIGGAPGGTAGGIKVTTAAIAVLVVLGALRGRSAAVAFDRRFTHRTVYKAIAITAMGVATVVAASIALLITQRMPGDVVIFEAFSAVGTVGLSLGGTALLDEVGKVIIMISMFLGRVGPLTGFLFLTESRRQREKRLLETNVEVG